MKDFSRLEKKIGLKFKNKDLIRQAFIHRSYLNEHPNFPLPHNERLEFLGDAVLELVVTEHLYKNYSASEGEMTDWRASLVKGETISEVAKSLGFDDFLYLSKGEKKSTGKARELILANAFEALIGAIYLDAGLRQAQKFISQFLLPDLPEILEKELYIDPKTQLQELTQEKFRITPRYLALGEWGPDHAKEFKIGVYLNNRLIGEGEGPSKQAAEQAAAQDALKKLKF